MARSTKNDSTYRHRSQQQPPVVRNHAPVPQQREPLQWFSPRTGMQHPSSSQRSFVWKLLCLPLRFALRLFTMLPPVRAICFCWRSVRRCSCTTLNVTRILLLWVLPAAIIISCATAVALCLSLLLFGLLRFLYVPNHLLAFPVYFDYNYVEPPLPQLMSSPAAAVGGPIARLPLRSYAVNAAPVDTVLLKATTGSSRAVSDHCCVQSLRRRCQQRCEAQPFENATRDGIGGLFELRQLAGSGRKTWPVSSANRWTPKPCDAVHPSDDHGFRWDVEMCQADHAAHDHGGCAKARLSCNNTKDARSNLHLWSSSAPETAVELDLRVGSTATMSPPGRSWDTAVGQHRSHSALALLFSLPAIGCAAAPATANEADVSSRDRPVMPFSRADATERPLEARMGNSRSSLELPGGRRNGFGSPHSSSVTSEAQPQQPPAMAQAMANSLLLTAMLDFADDSAQRAAALLDRAVGFVLLNNRSWEYTSGGESFIERCMKTRRAGKFFGVSAAGATMVDPAGVASVEVGVAGTKEGFLSNPDPKLDVASCSKVRAASRLLLRLVSWPFCLLWRLNPLVWAATRLGWFWNPNQQQSSASRGEGANSLPLLSSTLVNHYVDISLVLHHEYFSSSDPAGCSRILRHSRSNGAYRYRNPDASGSYTTDFLQEDQPKHRSVSGAVNRAIEDLLLGGPRAIQETHLYRPAADPRPVNLPPKESRFSIDEMGNRQTPVDAWHLEAEGQSPEMHGTGCSSVPPKSGAAAAPWLVAAQPNPGWQPYDAGGPAIQLQSPFGGSQAAAGQHAATPSTEAFGSCFTMVSLELYDDQCRRVGRSRRALKLSPTHLWMRLVNSAVGKVLFPFARGRARTRDRWGAPLQEEKISLVESFWLQNVADLKLARVEMAPAFVVNRAELVLELQLTGLRRVLRDRPLLALLILLPVSTSSLSCLFACCGIGAYARTLKMFSRRRSRRPRPVGS